MSPPLRPRILVFEDHDPLLTVRCEVLHPAGCDVSSASTTTEARVLLAGLGDP